MTKPELHDGSAPVAWPGRIVSNLSRRVERGVFEVSPLLMRHARRGLMRLVGGSIPIPGDRDRHGIYFVPNPPAKAPPVPQEAVYLEEAPWPTSVRGEHGTIRFGESTKPIGIPLGGVVCVDGNWHLDAQELPAVESWTLLERTDPTFVFLQGLRDHTVYLTRILSDHPLLLSGEGYFEKLYGRAQRSLAALGLEDAPLTWCRQLLSDRIDLEPPESEEAWRLARREALEGLSEWTTQARDLAAYLATVAQHEHEFLQRALVMRPISAQDEPELTGIFDADLTLDAIQLFEAALERDHPDTEIHLERRETLMLLLAGAEPDIRPEGWLQDLYVHSEGFQTRVPLRRASGRPERLVGSVDLPQGTYRIGRAPQAPPLRLWIYLLARNPI